MTNTDNNSYSNFYDSKLIVEFLQGLLPGDLHLKIQRQIKASEVFRTYVEGVQINFEKSGKNFEKMEADVAAKKAQTWSKLQRKMESQPTLSEKITYTLEQLKDFFLPNPQLELELQPTRAADTSQVQISINDTNKILRLILGEKNTQVVDFEIFDNKIKSIQQHKIPAGAEDFALPTASMHPGIYYAEFRPEEAEGYIISFYIQKNLKPS